MTSHVTSGEPPSVVRVLIAADVRLYREGLALALGHHDGIDVVGLASRPAQRLNAFH